MYYSETLMFGLIQTVWRRTLFCNELLLLSIHHTCRFSSPIISYLWDPVI